MAVDFVFLDSGTGGIPYLLKLKERMALSSCVYVADTANFPYGEKSHDEIVKCVFAVVQKIINQFKPEVIVIACNTISVNALNLLREAFPLQKFVGTVPAIKIAGEISKKRCIGLLATNSTIRQPYNQDLKNHFAADCKMILHGAPDLISFIEKKSFTATNEEIESAIKPSVDFFREQGCDVIILGCTHFLNYAEVFKKLAAPDIQVVDSVDGVVKRALNIAGGVAGLGLDKSRLSHSFDEPKATLVGSLFNGSSIVGSARKGSGSPAGWSEGKAFPTSKLYITGFSDKKDEKEYDVICERYGLSFGGIL